MNGASIPGTLRRSQGGRSHWPRASLSLPMIASITMSVTTVAAADRTKIQCVEANTKGQDLRRNGQFAEANGEFTLCAAAACPALVRDDCARRLDELERAWPSLVLDVKDRSGADLIDVRVRVDGRILVDHLDGSASKVDPGEHTLTFEAPASPVVSLPILVREGEKARLERVVIESHPVASERPPQSSPAAAGHEPPVLDSDGPHASRFTLEETIALSLAGGGVVALGVGGVFGALAVSAWDNTKAACGGNPSQCNDVSRGSRYHDETLTEGLISTIGFVAGGVLLSAAVVTYFHHRGERAAGSRAITLTPSAGPGQAGLVAHGSFW